jgi:ribosomal protein L35
MSLPKNNNKNLFGVSTILTAARGNHTAKTHSGMKKRFRVRPNGSIKRSQAGRSHNTGYKARSRKNRLAQSAGIKDRTIERKLLLCLGSK